MDTNFKTTHGLSLFIRNEVSFLLQFKKQVIPVNHVYIVNFIDKKIIVHFTFIFFKRCHDTKIYSTFINEMEYHSDWLVKMVQTLRGLS